MRDEKLVRAAMKAKQPVERVIWVWGAILESAAEIDDGGRYELDAAEVAYFLRADETDIRAIEDALAALERVVEGVVVHWGDRQFQSDRSKDRQARLRENRNATSQRDSDGSTPSRDGGVTAADRHCDAPETETETETEKKESKHAVACAPAIPPESQGRGEKEPAAYPAAFELLWDCFPRSKNSSKFKAFKAWKALSEHQKDLCLDGVGPLIDEIELKRRSWPDFQACHLVTYINQRRWEALLEDAA